MTKININGEELAIEFNLATELSFEEITGRPFEPDTFKKPTLKDITYAAIASIIANNPGAKVDSEFILKELPRSKVKELAEVTMKEIVNWVVVPEIAEKHVQADGDSASEGSESPNA